MKACPACNSRYEDEVAFCARDGTPVVRDSTTQGSAVGNIVAERYRLVRKLGEGGMGEVYIGEHIHIEKRVAIKLLRSEIVSNSEAVARFRQEARSASSIGHPNIIQIDDFGTLSDGSVYLTMEYLDGTPLSELARQPLPLGRALDIIIQTAHGLGAAHAKGIIHRDMKPENIYVTQKDGRDVPKILDFGIAKVSGEGTNQHLTRTGTIFGTPFYMSPEQALGQSLDHRSDIYAMGVIMYEMFTGSVPFKAESFMGILSQHITAPPPQPSAAAALNGRTLPPELEAIVCRTLAKSPAERFQSMDDLVAGLSDVYRRYVGPGATMPHVAQPTPISRFVPVPTAAVPAATPMPMPQAPPRVRRTILVAVVGLVLAGGGAAGWYFVLGPERKGPVQVAPSPAAPAQPVVAAPAVAIDALPAVPSTSVTSRDKVRVIVASRPEGAAVFEGATWLGKTPHLVELDSGNPKVLRLELGGYEDATFAIDGTEDKVTRQLVRERRHRTSRPEQPTARPRIPVPDDSDELE